MLTDKLHGDIHNFGLTLESHETLFSSTSYTLLLDGEKIFTSEDVNCIQSFIDGYAIGQQVITGMWG